MLSRGRFELGAFAIIAVFLLSLAAPSWANFGDCSQPITAGPSPAATDCLFILQVAVSIQSCDPDPCVCAPKGTLPVTATDALLCLNLATAQPVMTNCPCSMTNDCFNSNPPSCGGECFNGDICAPDPFEPDFCECLSACEASAAPTCGGGCEGEEPGSVCQPLTFTAQGEPPLQVCICLPPNAEFCADGMPPDCDGVCQPGAACESDGGNACTCASLPVQGACAQASAPSCAGTCPDGFICEDGGGTCDCVVFQGQQETCFDVGAPICGGVCSFGEICATDFIDECECFSPCGLAQVPMCNGECHEDGESCVVVTVSFGGGSLDFCDCVPGP